MVPQCASFRQTFCSLLHDFITQYSASHPAGQTRGGVFRRCRMCPKERQVTFVPLHFDPGEAFQFDWSEDFAVLGGERTKLQMAHIKLSQSRAFLLRAYPDHPGAFGAQHPLDYSSIYACRIDDDLQDAESIRPPDAGSGAAVLSAAMRPNWRWRIFFVAMVMPIVQPMTAISAAWSAASCRRLSFAGLPRSAAM